MCAKEKDGFINKYIRIHPYILRARAGVKEGETETQIEKEKEKERKKWRMIEYSFYLDFDYCIKTSTVF